MWCSPTQVYCLYFFNYLVALFLFGIGLKLLFSHGGFAFPDQSQPIDHCRTQCQGRTVFSVRSKVILEDHLLRAIWAVTKLPLTTPYTPLHCPLARAKRFLVIL